LTVYDVAYLLVPQPPGLPLGLSLVTIAVFFVAAFGALAAYVVDVAPVDWVDVAVRAWSNAPVQWDVFCFVRLVPPRRNASRVRAGRGTIGRSGGRFGRAGNQRDAGNGRHERRGREQCGQCGQR